MSNFDFAAFWNQGDSVSHFIAICLFIMSILSWTVILGKAFRIMRMRAYAKNAQEGFWTIADWNLALRKLGGPRLAPRVNPFYALAADAEAAMEHKRIGASKLEVKMNESDWLAHCLKNSLDDQAENAQAGMVVLASISSTAPFVGLFGTVWGIYHALHAIGIAGQASLGQVAGPVGEALIMTALGLFVAIPAVLGYNVVARRNKALMHKLNRFAYELHSFFLTGARVEVGREPAASTSKTSNA